MMDIVGLLPHSKRDVKVQSKDNKSATLNELVDLKGCSSCLFFEVCMLGQKIFVGLYASIKKYSCLSLIFLLDYMLLFKIIHVYLCWYLQCRKKKDLYLWMSKCPAGPSVKFLVKAGINCDVCVASIGPKSLFH